ncbi:MAG: hypothetical protein K0U66_09885 [Gammaproteobacteria bacterium]|nr:hypothetical protein [Pseudomonadota bacterium]MCH9663944.1 hypothetical protein [Gammaproteobacteria bacterium]
MNSYPDKLLPIDPYSVLNRHFHALTETHSRNKALDILKQGANGIRATRR